MLQTIKFRGDEKTFFFSADLHMNQSCASWDTPLWLARGYEDKEAHKVGVKKTWNQTCDENTTGFLLGDTIFEDESGEGFRDLIHGLRFKTLFVMLGNHNSGHGIVYKNVLAESFPNVFAVGGEVYPLEWKLSDRRTVYFLPEYVEICINKNFLVLQHYPILSHNKMSKWSIHLSGHCHNNLPLTNKDTGRGMRLDVGWDAWARPINLFDIKNHLKGRDMDAQDHHG